MQKKLLSLLLTLALLFGMAIPAFAAETEAKVAADKLNELGLFQGVGNNADGTPNYDLDRTPTRAEAVTLLVRLLGKDAEAKATTYTLPFTDVAAWAKPYVGYAYANGLTKGTGETTFGSNDMVSATQYLTFVLRALGYESGTDFAWDKAWEKTDELGLTAGEYTADAAFVRGDAAIVSAAALEETLKDGSKTLLTVIEANLAQAKAAADALAKAEELAAAAKSFEAKVTMNMDMSASVQGETATISMNMLMDMIAFADPMKLKMLATIDMGEAGKDTMEMYMVEKDGKATMYMNVAGTWQSMEMDISAMEGQAPTTDMNALLAAGGSVRMAGEETINGVKATKYVSVISGKAIEDAVNATGVLGSLNDMMPAEADMDIDWAALYKNLGDISYAVWVDAAGYPIRYEMDMTTMANAMITNIMAQMGETGVSMSCSKMLMIMDYSNYNKATDFQIPAAALQ